MSPNPLVFYNATVCPYAHRTWLALEEKKLPYKAIEIDLQNKPQVQPRGGKLAEREAFLSVRMRSIDQDDMIGVLTVKCAQRGWFYHLQLAHWQGAR